MSGSSPKRLSRKASSVLSDGTCPITTAERECNSSRSLCVSLFLWTCNMREPMTGGVGSLGRGVDNTQTREDCLTKEFAVGVVGVGYVGLVTGACLCHIGHWRFRAGRR